VRAQCSGNAVIMAHAHVALAAPAIVRGRTAARSRAHAANVRWVSTSSATSARYDGRVGMRRAVSDHFARRVTRDVSTTATEVRPDIGADDTARDARARVSMRDTLETSAVDRFLTFSPPWIRA